MKSCIKTLLIPVLQRVFCYQPYHIIRSATSAVNTTTLMTFDNQLKSHTSKSNASWNFQRVTNVECICAKSPLFRSRENLGKRFAVEPCFRQLYIASNVSLKAFFLGAFHKLVKKYFVQNEAGVLFLFKVFAEVLIHKILL